MKNKRIIYILALAVFLIGTIEYIITGVIEMIAVDLGVSTSEVGLLVTVFALSAAIVAPVLIALTINADRKKLLMTNLGVFIASNGLMFVDLAYETVLWIRIIQGASGGIATVVAMAIATRLVEKEKRGNAIGIILMGLSSSLVLGVPVGTFFSELFGWRVLFVLIGLLSIFPLLIIYKKVPAIKEEEKVTLRMQLSILKNPTILMALVITLFYVGGYSTLFTYITPFLQATSSLSMTEISGVLFLAGICSFVGSKLGGQLADAKGSKFTICLGLLLQGTTLLLFALAGVNLLVLILVLMIFMLATWSISPAQQLYLVTLAPRNPDIALSVNTSFIQFGFALGSGLGGLVISRTSVLYLNWLGFAAVCIALLLAILLFKKMSSRTKTTMVIK
ncbi:MFS transporter [Paenibacillus odorifer]|uniref:MFS transporter n=1 Tax=Paenibacillus TaxID=44249 RepID=UPI00096ED823|nr:MULTISPECIES: MFS transporter [Paenibacillus]MDH6429802.1 DHA1 family putative efflux transporter-like MFS transporter [Paenibacillus sp. PastH-4]MDH6446098.1 DHA1 family putative efflux transporter-like MFS transporter [Paenibacillus sp. PastF-4]MDH6530433.1 DHA1 family putative efflux transporter-like MFS transporter [Paenibacillus sp. PastH-3]OMD63865.1 MFS transporter [Paenibacillus odorifer]